MGESLVEAPKLENKMGDSLTSISCFQESVSFGRFEHDDSLCWERWSTFPTNRYLEEVEKCSTPGSVAQKKAYFEAHYRRIAARKVELLEEEKNREAKSGNSEDQNRLSSVCNTSEEEVDVEKPITQNSVELNEVGSFTGEVSDKHIDIPISSDDLLFQESEIVNLTSEISDYFEQNRVSDLTSVASETFEENGAVNLTSEASENSASDAVGDVDEVTDLASEVSEHIDEQADVAKEKKKLLPEHNIEPHYDSDSINEKQDIQSEPEDASVDLCLETDIPELVKSDEPVLVKVEITYAQVWHDKEVLSQEKIEEREIALAGTKQPVKLVDPLKTKKTTLATKATTCTTNAKKKPASPIPKRPAAAMPKSPMISAPKSSKPELVKSANSTARPLVKQENTPLTSKKVARPESTKVARPEGAKVARPEGAKVARPEGAKVVRPESTRVARPESTEVARPESKKVARPESKKVFPTSLHISLSHGLANADPASLTTMKKSLIMESMGDKDIVKRAFKSFQNGNRLPQYSLVKPAATNQPATKRTELKASAPNTVQKKNEGTIRSAKVTSSVINQQGMKNSLQSPGLKKSIGVDQRNDKAVRPVTAPFGSRSRDLGRQHKQVPKKVEQKTAIKDAGMTNRLSKLKAVKVAENGKPSHNSISKTKLSSSYSHGHGFLRGSARKENAKI